MKSLIVIDCQFDFTCSKGSLYVDGSDGVINNVEAFIGSGEVDEVIFTADFHKITDKSFKVNGGQWPVHCVNHTLGAIIAPWLIEACIKANIPWQVLRKGELPEVEEYGAFSEIKTVNGSMLRLSSKTCSIYTESSEFIVCGVAGDYCVKESLKGLLHLPTHCKLSVMMNGIASIDGGEALNQFLNDNKIINIL